MQARLWINLHFACHHVGFEHTLSKSFGRSSEGEGYLEIERFSNNKQIKRPPFGLIWSSNQLRHIEEKSVRRDVYRNATAQTKGVRKLTDFRTWKVCSNGINLLTGARKCRVSWRRRHCVNNREHVTWRLSISVAVLFLNQLRTTQLQTLEWQMAFPYSGWI